MPFPKVKVCGVNEAAFARRAEELGADFLGLIFAKGSPRCVSVAEAKAIVAGLCGTARTVGVFTTASADEIVTAAAEVGFRVVQLHRRASDEDVARLKAAGFEVWTLAGGSETADALLFDSSHGDGETALRKGAWTAILAGGISADNLRDALTSGADVIDVSGSLESSRGVKSIPRLEAFWSVLETERNTPGRSRA